MDQCYMKHTKIQIPDKEFKCPRCNAEAGDFCVEESINLECELLHPDDVLYCNQCDYCTTAKKYIAEMIKKKNQIKCPHCKGTGMIKKDKNNV